MSSSGLTFADGSPPVSAWGMFPIARTNLASVEARTDSAVQLQSDEHSLFCHSITIIHTILNVDIGWLSHSFLPGQRSSTRQLYFNSVLS